MTREATDDLLTRQHMLNCELSDDATFSVCSCCFEHLSKHWVPLAETAHWHSPNLDCLCILLLDVVSFMVFPLLKAPRTFGGGGNAGSNLSSTASSSRSRDSYQQRRREDRVERSESRQDGNYRELVRRRTSSKFIMS